MKQTTIDTQRGRRGTDLFLGRVGENNTRQIIFDCTDFQRLYGAGTANLVAQLPDGTKYVPAQVVQEGSMVRWTISASDVGTAGTGKVELAWIVKNIVAKTCMYHTKISHSLTSSKNVGTKPPAPYRDWVDQLLQACQRSVRDAASAEEYVQRVEAALNKVLDLNVEEVRF